MGYERKTTVQYFSGEWVKALDEKEAITRAMGELHFIVMKCADFDMRDRSELAAALDYLAEHMSRAACLRDFRKALDLVDPAQRWQAARRAYNVICDRLPREL